MRGVEIREGKRRKAVEILKILRAKAEIKEIRRIGEIIEKGRKMMLIKLTRKRGVKGGDDGGKEKFEKKKERITEDLTWRERKTRWKLQEIARRKRKGEGYG